MNRRRIVLVLLVLVTLGAIGKVVKDLWPTRILNVSESDAWKTKPGNGQGFDSKYSPVIEESMAQDWFQFLGPHRNGVIPKRVDLKPWPKDGLKRVWSVSVEQGFGGVAIRDGFVYLFERRDDEENVLRCIDFKTGEESWRLADAVPGRTSFNGSRSVPTVTEDSVFGTDAFGNCYCFSLKEKKIVWKKSLVSDWDANIPQHGYGVSPLVLKDRVVVAVMNSEICLLALDRRTGEESWRSKGFGGNSYMSPMLVSFVGVPQIIYMTNEGVLSVDPETGKSFWDYRDFRSSQPIAPPTVIDGDRLFLTSGLNSGSRLVKVEREAGAWSLKALFVVEVVGAQLHPGLYYNGFIYANFNRNGNVKKKPDGLVCLDLNGGLRWQTKSTPGVDRGNLILLGDHLLSIGGNDGVLRLIEPNPEEYREKSSAVVVKALKKRNNQIWSPMAYSAGKLIVRGSGRLICVELP
ncbi:MAG: PQQ-binding-like beta-propeller repeat protein [Planctomycetota bacterium]|nr:PQQ-binding-like beta-propeller repeat protein [Planctomycetota bacterium]